MGGADNRDRRTTRNVLVEAANFDEVSIARTARRHKLPTEASKRYERGVDWRMPRAPRRGWTCSWSNSPAAQPTPAGAIRRRARADGDRAARRLRSPPHRRRLHRGAGRHDALEMIGATVTASTADLDGHAAELAPRPHRQGDPGRGGRPHRRLRPDPVGAAGGAGRRGLTRAQRARRRIGQTLAAAGATEVLDVPFVSEATSSCSSRGAPPCASRTRSTRSASLLRRPCCPVCSRRAAATCRAASPTSPCSNSAPCSARGPACVRNRLHPRRRRTTGCRDDRRARGGHPAAGWRVGALSWATPSRSSPEPRRCPPVCRRARRRASAGPRARRRHRGREGSHPALHPGRTAELRVGGPRRRRGGELLPSIAAESTCRGSSRSSRWTSTC